MHILEQQKDNILDILKSHIPFNQKEGDHLNFIIEFIKMHEIYTSRKNLKGHLTASAWILNQTRNKVLLIHHSKLDRWLQPGGHIEQDDESLYEAALREALEETGLKSVLATKKEIFDVDVHIIPARKKEPEHYHLDIRYLFRADENEDLNHSNEVKDMQWVSLDSLNHSGVEESIRRMVRKSLGFLVD